MIFFGAPSVNQPKHETLFGNDDHYGFIKTMVGKIYEPSDTAKECQTYYGKENKKYWGQIITLIHFAGLKKLDDNNRFCDIPLVSQIHREYDKGNILPAKALFDYLLCQWQYPHPTTRRTALKDEKLNLILENPRENCNLIKPYGILLSILKELQKTDQKNKFITREEFYWLGYYCYKTKGRTFEKNSVKNLVDKIIEIRKNKGWSKWSKIKDLDGTKTHLSYPMGLLRNSSILTFDKSDYGADSNFFCGLIPDLVDTSKLDSLIEYTFKNYFEFDRSTSPNANILGYNFSEYLYNPETFLKWMNYTDLFNAQGKFIKTIKTLPKNYIEKDTESMGMQYQLERLIHLDVSTKSKRRTEQHLLRKYILSGKTKKCAICDNEYPIDLLTAAHIKKRSTCTDDEKRDINIVMPACYLGCDILYEKGYITISEGLINGNYHKKFMTKDLKSEIKKIEGARCSFYNDASRKYFQDHYRMHG